MNVLEVRNIDISQIGNETEPICKNVSFTLTKGETLGILGESGSGKSLTALSVIQLLPKSLCNSKGQILFTQKNGSVIDLIQKSGSQLQNIRGKEISMVFQEPMSALNPVYTCGYQVDEISRQHLGFNNAKAKSYTIELFKKVRLTDPERIYRSYPFQLSGGQKQRVMIAMAIACNPQILIADEPTTALDVSVQKSILQLLKDLQHEMGMSILFITHDINVLAEISHKAAVFYKGEVVETGEILDILNVAKHLYTKGLMECRKSIQNKGERLKTIQDFLNETPNQLVNSEYTKLTQNDDSVFEVEDLGISYGLPKTNLFGKPGKTEVLKNISFKVFKNETLGIVGESGSGKTTTGRSLIKLIENYSGKIRFHGKEINTLNSDQLNNFRQRVQIIFQDPFSSLNPKLTVGEAIAEPIKFYKLTKTARERKEKVIELLQRVGLIGDYYNRYPHQFSGGQRQRIGIARALAVNPEILILDESVAALDVSVQAQVLNLLNDLKVQYGLTYIFISHDLNVVRYMSDRILVLNKGLIAEQGDSEQIFNNPSNEYTRELIQSKPGLQI